MHRKQLNSFATGLFTFCGSISDIGSIHYITTWLFFQEILAHMLWRPGYIGAVLFGQVKHNAGIYCQRPDGGQDGINDLAGAIRTTPFYYFIYG